MKNINLMQTAHVFEKINLTTLKGGYDQLQCTRCGLKAKRWRVSEFVKPDGRSSKNKIQLCIGEDYIGRLIKINICTANGKAFANVTSNSEHLIIEPPKGYNNGDKGVWIMGVGEPVKVLFDEFKYI